jgi:hypothetical protein
MSPNSLLTHVRSLLLSDNPDPSDDERQFYRKFFVFYLMNLHYPLFFLAYIVRYARNKSLGVINMSGGEPRPRTYKIKIAL